MLALGKRGMQDSRQSTHKQRNLQAPPTKSRRASRKLYNQWEATCEGKDGTVRPAARQKIGHVATPSVDKDGAGIQIVGHVGCAGAQLLADAPLELVS